MSRGLTVVLDVGKTLTKLTLWSEGAEAVAREVRPNRPADAGGYAALDTPGIESWLAQVLSDFVRRGPIEAIVPVGHGAALAIVRDGRLVCAPPDYEQPVPDPIRENYRRDRDGFEFTGSPELPNGLNAGVQLAWLERLYPGLLMGGALILSWPQYWSWRLCGVASTEVTSLGCHTDLWRPLEARPSTLAIRRGWAAHLAPLRRAHEVLGTVTAEWVARAGLPRTTRVYCGIHDSNAALLAARGFREMASGESTVLSTGTWFVAMRSPADGVPVALSAAQEQRDCLLNVDAFGRPIPSSRFMGGRELEQLIAQSAGRIDTNADQHALLAAARRVIARGVYPLPTFTPGVGPFRLGRGRWVGEPADEAEQRAAAALYVALVADTSLSLIGARERLLVEGRFAAAEVFVRALAALRPSHSHYISNTQHDVSYGALRLIDPDLRAVEPLRTVVPLSVDLSAYAARWRHEANSEQAYP